MAVYEEVAEKRAWPPVLAPLALVAGFGAAVLGGLVVGVLGAIAGASLTHPPASVTLISTMVQDIALVGSAIFFAAQIARPSPAQFGLRPTRLQGAITGLVLGYGGFIAFTAAWEAVLNIHDKEKLVDQLGANSSAVALVAVCLLTCVVAPICEEFFFRGFFFTVVSGWCGRWLGAAVTGIVFGAIHAGSAPVSYLVPLAFFGFVLCIIYWRTGSLYPCIALHAVNNAVAVASTEHWTPWEGSVLVVASLAAIGVVLSGVARLAPAE
jgi:membrane protease YdiL (CAAX protease family)